MHARRVRRAQKCAEVVRILDLVEQQEERWLALFLGTREDVIERGVGDRRSIGDDALVAHVGRELVELLSLARPHGHALLACKREKRRERRLLRALRDENAIDAAPRLQRLENGVPADENLSGRRRIAPLLLPPVALQGRSLFLRRLFLLLRFHPSHHLPPFIQRTSGFTMYLASHGSSSTRRSRIPSIMSRISHCAPGVVTRFS